MSCPIPISDAQNRIRRHVGRPVLCSQFVVHHRCPINTRTRSERADYCLHAYFDPRRERFSIDSDVDAISPYLLPGSPLSSLCSMRVSQPLFAAFLTLLRKRWVNRYIRNNGGSAANRSRDRQETGWAREVALPPLLLHFRITSRTVAWAILAFTPFKISSCAFFILTETLHYNCSYQTPPSIFTWTLIRYLTYSGSGFARSLRSLVTSLAGVYFPVVENFERIISRLHAGNRSAPSGLGRVPGVPGEEEHIAPAVVPSTGT